MKTIGALFLFIAQSTNFAFAEEIRFSEECRQEESAVVAFVGDLLLHKPLQVKASLHGYEKLWSKITPFLKSADIVYANLEGPITSGLNSRLKEVAKGEAWNFEAYTGYPLFNYHPSLGTELKRSGINIVSTANNHALDRGAIGIDKTIDALKQSNIEFSGTRKKDSQSDFTAITAAGGFTIAWIACTEHTNGIQDKYNQVLYCYRPDDFKRILNTISQTKSSVDAIIVTPHFGEEYQRNNNAAQTRFAKAVLDAGASAVIGSHPHVLQPVEKYVTKDQRETLIAYSLGNFVSYQGSVDRQSSLVLFLKLSKNKNQKASIRNMRYLPILMDNRSGQDRLEARPLSAEETLSEHFKTITKSAPKENAMFSLPIDWGCK